MVLYVPRAPRKEHLVLNTPKKFDEKKAILNVPRLYVPKGNHMARGPLISPRLTESVVISPAPESRMKYPTTVPCNYSKTVVTYRVKEIMGEVKEMTRSGRYYTLDELRKSKQNRDKQMPPKKPVSNENFRVLDS